MKAQTAEMTQRRIESAPAHYRSMFGGWDGSSIDDVRIAVCRGARSVDELRRYLPGNYALAESFLDDRGELIVIIGGIDDAGWTLDGYVIPRLVSGAMSVVELV